MISLDQVYLLEQKVESAVAKIQQLQAENDALRSKCAELTNALSAKSEQLSSFETDQSQIEDGIKKALDRLNSIENSVLKTVSTMAASSQAAPTTPVAPVQPQVIPQPQTIIQPVIQEEPQIQQSFQEPEMPEPSFDSMNEMDAPQFDSEPDMFDTEPDIEPPEEDNQDGLSFDIF